MKDLAKGLAGLGRNGDSMLVHMQPGEVAGLQALAKSQGTSLTINPDTGLPEAFNLGNMFRSLLPTAVGFMLGGPAGATIGSKFGATAQAVAPILGGALTGAALAGSNDQDPLMGALTGGFSGYGGAGLAGKVTAAGTAPVENALGTWQAQAANAPGTNELFPNPASSTGALPSKPITDISGVPVAPNFNVQPAGGGYTPGTDFTATTLAGTETPQLSQFQSGLQNVMNRPMDFLSQPGNTMAVGMPLGMAALSGLEPSDLYGNPIKPKEDKYDPYATLNLSGSTGLKLYADGGSVQSGGLRDLYGTSDSANIGAISQDGYGLGRLNNLVNQTDLTRAQDYAYADGGDVSLNLNTGKRGPTSEAPSEMSSSRLPPLAMAALGRRIPNDVGLSPMALASLGREIPNDIGLSPMALAANPFLARLMSDEAPTGTPITSLNLNSGKQETRYIAKGGYLDGAGDGMSDSIPASIEGRQPARLADGEFVVPADVVSHIGNGSSKAGAKRLYAMLDRVREARTGTKKQGKEINPKKYMPA